MSDDDTSLSGSESEDLTTTGLVATRAKRRTAGNLYETLRANLDDEDLQRELLAEDEAEDAADYQSSEHGSEHGDEDDALDSSSDDEDASPSRNDAGDEDLEGEKELKKVERAEQRKKRKVHEARLKLPAWAKKAKKVKLADDAKTEDGANAAAAEAERPRKKSERSNWLPAAAELPTRQSARSLAVANREVVHANLKQSAEKSEKQRALLKDSVKRERARKRVDLSPEQRLEKCRRIEKETAKELGRFEREEAERIRLREEALAAKRRRGFDGPIIRTLSVSGLYENGKLKIKRLPHGSQKVEDIVERQGKLEERDQDTAGQPDGTPIGQSPNDGAALGTSTQTQSVDNSIPDATQTQPMDLDPPSNTEPGASKAASANEPQAIANPMPSESVNEPSAKALGDDSLAPDDPNEAVAGAQRPPDEHNAPDSTDTARAMETASMPLPDAQVPVQAPVSWLSGIHEYAALPTQTETAMSQTSLPYFPSAPGIHGSPDTNQATSLQTQQQAASPNHYQAGTTPAASQAGQPFTKASWPPGSQAFHLSTTHAPQQPPAPVLREQAQRSLLILESFANLEGTTTTKRYKTGSYLEPTPVAQILLPDSYPTFKEEEAIYLKKARKQKQEPLSRPKCALTTWPGRYRDPKTSVVYADVGSYKMLQRIIAGGCNWSGMLECWVGPAYGRMGRAARGVPEGFERPMPVETKEQDVKMDDS